MLVWSRRYQSVKAFHSIENLFCKRRTSQCTISVERFYSHRLTVMEGRQYSLLGYKMLRETRVWYSMSDLIVFLRFASTIFSKQSICSFISLTIYPAWYKIICTTHNKNKESGQNLRWKNFYCIASALPDRFLEFIFLGRSMSDKKYIVHDEK